MPVNLQTLIQPGYTSFTRTDTQFRRRLLNVYTRRDAPIGPVPHQRRTSFTIAPAHRLRPQIYCAAGTPECRELYEASEKIEAGELSVSDGHTLYYQVHGNPDGPAAVFLHGGPGAGCFSKHACFFDPSFWKVILFDQRGCGRSKPSGSLAGNTTQDLVNDLEVLRDHLSINSWVILGGSWGVTLALAYAVAHPMRVNGMVLRGICMMRQKEIDWMYRGGASVLFPQGWQSFLSILSEDERKDPLTAYSHRLLSDELDVREEAACHWKTWDMTVMFSGDMSEKLIIQNGQFKSLSGDALGSILPSPPPSKRTGEVGQRDQNAKQRKQQKFSGVQALLECHYSINGAFLEEDLCDNVESIRHIPCIGVHGRLDFVCPVGSAYDLAIAWPEMQLHIIPGAGHSMYHPQIRHELIKATDQMKLLQLSAMSSML